MMKITKITKLHASKWLELKEASYTNRHGQKSTWQFVERTGNPSIVTMIVYSRETGKILLIRQPRVPVDSAMIEFPAGIVDKGETAEQAALRELKEETGYTATVEKVSPLLPKSAGLTNEATTLVFCVADEMKKGEKSTNTSEDITHFWIHPEEFFDHMKSLKGVKIALDVYAYFLGLQSPKK